MHDWLRSLTKAANIATVSVRISTIPLRLALRIRPRPITTTIRHECRATVEFPRFITIHQDSPRFYYESPRYTTILQIVANRSGTVAKNRECLNRPLKPHLHIHDFRLRCRYDSPRFVKSSCTVVIRSRTVVNLDES